MSKKTKIFKLGDVCHSVGGSGSLIKGKQVQNYREGLYPAYSATGQDIWREEYDNEGSAIIISAVGARCGKCFKADGKWTAIANTHVIFPNKGISRDYIFYILNNENFWIKGGAAQPFVKIKDSMRIKTISIPVDKNDNPDLEEQKRIVSLFKEVEKLKEKRLEANQKIDTVTMSLFLMMFGDPISNTMQWEKVPLSDLGTLDRGKSQHRPRTASELFGGKYPFVQTGDVSNAGWRLSNYTQTYTEKGLAQSKLWPKETLCITIAANIAKTTIINFEGCFPDSIVGFTANKEYSNVDYVQALFMFLQKGLEEIAPQAAQKNINLAILRTLMVPKPPIELQNKFAELVKEVEIQKDKQKKSTQKVDELFNSVMAKSFV